MSDNPAAAVEVRNYRRVRCPYCGEVSQAVPARDHRLGYDLNRWWAVHKERHVLSPIVEMVRGGSDE